MEIDISRKIVSFLSIIITHLLSTSKGMVKVGGFYPTDFNSWNLLKEFADTNIHFPVLQHQSQSSRPSSTSHYQMNNHAQSKVVFPIPEDVVMNRSYLPDLGFLTDMAFLFFLPRDLPASGLVRLSRDLFESEQCVQYVSCEMTKVAQRHQSLDWMHNLLQDFPFQGDVADRLRQGSMDAISKFNKRKTTADGNGTSAENNNNNSRVGVKRRQEDEICTFSCHPISSLTRGLKILTLLHDLVRTVK